MVIWLTGATGLLRLILVSVSLFLNSFIPSSYKVPLVSTVGLSSVLMATSNDTVSRNKTTAGVAWTHYVYTSEYN